LWPPNTAVSWQAILYDRPNLDPWRLHLEFTALVAIWVWRRPRPRKRITLLFAGLYLFALVYTLYEGFIRSYYLLDPIWYNDFPLFRDGAHYVLHSLHLAPIVYFLALAALAGLAALVALLLHALLNTSTQIGSQRVTRWVLLALLVWATAVWLAKGSAMSEPSTAVASLTSKLAHNASLSQEAWQASRQFTRDRLTPFYEQTPADLATKPNIYLIFVESYGSVLYQRPDFRRNYLALTSQLNDDLTADGWHVVSSRSESPTWGGGSWIAYTSAISGLPITAHAQYLLLLNQYQTQTLPSLPNYLRQQGYKSYSISGNADVLPEIEWQRYKLFYGIDQWWRVDELSYTGPLYGWGPSLPDQYAFGYAQEQMRQQGEPHFLFYVTQNSHYPWHPLPPVTADWQELATLPTPSFSTERVPHAVLRQRYWRAIERQLEGLLGDVQTHGRANDLYIIIGDHQPARVANYGDGWDTPIHIVTQDPALAEAFLPFGFVPGFDTEALTPAPLHHAGLYSLLSHVLLTQYGADPTTAPPYLPFGTQQK
ncbi:MAG: sulfatase-like hydrolase/transferase, partial [Anaerolineales bacterium]|nr:sulfatase-like hydrolase/transferase [Anaerolineales bacterium]